MSGIAGVYHLDGLPASQSETARMVQTLAHRGPDHMGVHIRASVGLGHHMLWTTPESLREELPAVDASGTLAITADAVLDNRAALLAALAIDQPPAEVSDSALILAAYRAWGEQCAARLLGAFAFAIWDAAKRQLFCARDHFGVKPFYYYYRARDRFLFGSEIKALLAIAETPRQLNEAMVVDYLLSALDDRSLTFFQGIFRLPAAHYLVVNDDALRIEPYWSLDAKQAVRLPSDEAYAEAFRELFIEAVRCRLRSAYPIGASLSGGLDSSSIVCTAQQVLARESSDRRLSTFSCLFADLPACDEQEYIETVVAHAALAPTYLQGNRLNPLGDLEQVFWHHDEPSAGANLYLPWNLTKAARKAGIRVLLDGFDGDTTVSHGDFFLTELAYNGQWATFAEEAAHLAQGFSHTAADFLHSHGQAALTRLARRQQWLTFARQVDALAKYFPVSRRYFWLHYGIKPNIPAAARGVWRRMRGQTLPAQPIMSREFARHARVRQHVQQLQVIASKQPRTLQEEHWRNLTAGGLAYIFELSDKTAAAHGIEARHPFMDKRLAEFCLALPPQQKLHHGWPRRILRTAMTGILPETIRLRRSKSNLEPNFVHTLLTFERQRIDQLIYADADAAKAYFDWPHVQTAYQRLCAHAYSSEDIMAVWKAVNLTLWLRYAGFSAG